MKEQSLWSCGEAAYDAGKGRHGRAKLPLASPGSKGREEEADMGSHTSLGCASDDPKTSQCSIALKSPPSFNNAIWDQVLTTQTLWDFSTSKLQCCLGQDVSRQLGTHLWISRKRWEWEMLTFGVIHVWLLNLRWDVATKGATVEREDLRATAQGYFDIQMSERGRERNQKIW